jgi:hypothetical protein
MPTMEQRIAALESELAALKAAKAPPARPVEEEGVRILAGRAAGAPHLVLPSDKEFRALRDIVGKHYAFLNFVPRDQRYVDSDEAEDFAGFKVAFEYLAGLERTEKIAEQYGTNWWRDAAEGWARDMGLPSSIPNPAFLAAVVAHNDIVFTDLASYSSFGLGRTDSGKRYSQAWRQLLSSGKVLQPVNSRSSRAA